MQLFNSLIVWSVIFKIESDKDEIIQMIIQHQQCSFSHHNLTLSRQLVQIIHLFKIILYFLIFFLYFSYFFKLSKIYTIGIIPLFYST